MVRNPHSFYLHVLTQHDALSLDAKEAGYVLAAPPRFPPAWERELETLSECALIHVPLQWLAAMPIASLPPGIQGRLRAYIESIAAQQQQPHPTTTTTPVSAAVALVPQQLHGDIDDAHTACATQLSSLL